MNLRVYLHLSLLLIIHVDATIFILYSTKITVYTDEIRRIIDDFRRITLDMTVCAVTVLCTAITACVLKKAYISTVYP